MRFEVRGQLSQHIPLLKTGSSRGRVPLFLDENLVSVKHPLEQKGFVVLVPKSGKPSPDLAEYLPGRIFVTDNPRDLVYSAALLDFSIIDTADVTKEPQGLADVIARAWVDYNLKAEHPAFLLVLKLDGRHELTTVAVS
jgi:hypothetical protein